MKYQIAAIETTYCNVKFRSRLEAKWARFFDLCGWSWTYEPFDLQGWIPDFLLETKRPTLVEVKPHTTPLELVDEATVRMHLAPQHDMLFLGATLMPAGVLSAKAYGFGIHLQPHPPELLCPFGGDSHGMGSAQLIRCQKCAGITAYNSLHTPRCMLNGCDLSEVELTPDSAAVERVFRRAGNKVRWEKNRGRPLGVGPNFKQFDATR